MTNQLRSRRFGIRSIAIVGGVSLVLLLSGVGQSASQAANSAKKPAAATAKKLSNPLPVMTVTDVKAGKPFALASVFTGKLPVLLWFWAPT